MSDLDILARAARSAPTGVAPTPMDALHRRADRRRSRKRKTAGGVLSIAVVLVVAALAIGVGRRTPDSSVQVGPEGSVTTTAPPPTSESTTASTATTSTTDAPTTTTAPPPPSATAPPPPAQIDGHSLSTDGLRPITFDMTADQVSALLGIPIPANGTDNGCGAAATRNAYGVLPGVDLVFHGGRKLTYISVNQPGVTTLSGIGVGTPVQTLTAKLPSAVRSDVSQTVYTVFNSDHSRSIAFHIGADGTVASMLAGVGDMTNVLDYC
jgi:hypothetical protein